MKFRGKTFWSGILAIFLGTSCCWVSAVVVWTGSIGILTAIANYTESINVFLITGGILLLLITSFRHYSHKNSRL